MSVMGFQNKVWMGFLNSIQVLFGILLTLQCPLGCYNSDVQCQQGQRGCVDSDSISTSSSLYLQRPGGAQLSSVAAERSETGEDRRLWAGEGYL